MHLSHPFRITVSQIIIDCYNMDTAPGQGVQISRKCGHQGLSFTGLHLGDTSLMQDNPADKLHTVMLHIQNTLCRLPDRGKCLRQKIIQRFSFSQTFFELSGLASQLFIRQLLHLRTQRLDFIYDGCDSLQFTGTVSAKYSLR